MIAIHRMAPADFLRMHLAMEVTIQILPPFASGWSLDDPAIHCCRMSSDAGGSQIPAMLWRRGEVSGIDVVESKPLRQGPRLSHVTCHG